MSTVQVFALCTFASDVLTGDLPGVTVPPGHLAMFGDVL